MLCLPCLFFFATIAYDISYFTFRATIALSYFLLCIRKFQRGFDTWSESILLISAYVYCYCCCCLTAFLFSDFAPSLSLSISIFFSLAHSHCFCACHCLKIGQPWKSNWNDIEMIVQNKSIDFCHTADVLCIFISIWIF